MHGVERALGPLDEGVAELYGIRNARGHTLTHADQYAGEIQHEPILGKVGAVSLQTAAQLVQSDGAGQKVHGRLLDVLLAAGSVRHRDGWLDGALDKRREQLVEQRLQCMQRCTERRLVLRYCGGIGKVGGGTVQLAAREHRSSTHTRRRCRWGARWRRERDQDTSLFARRGPCVLA